MSEQVENVEVEGDPVVDEIEQISEPDGSDDAGDQVQGDADPKHEEQTVPLSAMLDERRKRQEYQHFVEEMRENEQRRQQQAPQQTDDGSPTLEQFGGNFEAWQRALVDHRLASIDNERKRQQVVQQFNTRLESAVSDASKPGDYQARIDQLFNDRNLPISQAMAEVILTEESGPDLAYYLHANPKEMRRIFSLSPIAQATAMARIADKISQKSVSVTGAPPPTKPVRTSKGSASVDPSKMSTDEWMEWRRKQIA